MKIVDRYLVKNFILTFLFCVAAFSVLCILVDLFNHLDDIIAKHIPFFIVGKYYLYFLPMVFSQVSPIATLISVIYMIGMMKKNNELIIIRSTGNNPLKTMIPLFMIAILIGFIHFCNDNVFLPTVLQKKIVLQKMYFSINTYSGKKDLPYVRQNITFIGTGNKMYFAKTYDEKEKILTDVIILSHNLSNQLIGKVTIGKMLWKKDKWIGINMLQSQIDPRTGGLDGTPQFFKKIILKNIHELPEDFCATSQYSQETLTSQQLLRYASKIQTYQPKTMRILMVVFYERLAPLCIHLIIMLITAAISLQSSRKEIFIGLGKVLIFIFFYYLLNAIALTLGKAGYLPAYLAGLGAHILFAGIGIFLFSRKQ